MRITRGLLSLAILLAAVFLAPIVLITAWRPPDISAGWRLLFTPDDGTLLVFVLDVIGWAAWAVFVVSVVIHVAELFTHGRVRWSPRGLRAPRRAATALVGAVLALMAVRASSPAPQSIGATASVAAQPAPEEPPAPPATSSPSEAGQGWKYTVASGDDLWSLAEQFLGSGTRWPEIVAVNPGFDPRLDLVEGQAITIPADERPSPEAQSAQALNATSHTPTGPVDQATHPTTVTVQQGDSLWTIAEAQLGDGSRWREIHQLNTTVIQDPNAIEIGWVLRLPGTTSKSEVDAQASPHVDQELDTFPIPADDVPDPDVQVPDLADAEEPIDDEQAEQVAGESAANPVLLALGATGPLLAAGLTAAVVAARESQRWGRPRGRRFLPLEPAGLQVQTALIKGADPPRLSRLETALRLIGEHCQVFAMEPPGIATVYSSADRITFSFRGSAPDAPSGFERTKEAWSLSSDVEVDEPQGPYPYPALVTLGADKDRSVLVDLRSHPVVGIDGDADLVNDVAHAWVLELATAPWAQELELHITPAVAETLVSDRDDVRIASAQDLVTELEQIVTSRGTGLAQHGLSDQYPVTVFVFDATLPTSLRERVLRAESAAVGVVTVLAHDHGTSTWTVGRHGDTGGTLTPAGLQVPQAQAMAAETRTAVAQLRQAADSFELSPAAWWATDESATPSPILAATAPNQEATVPGSRAPLHPVLNILGSIELLGATGAPPSRGQRTCMEYCAWLLEHPGSTSPAMAGSLLVAESSRRSSMSRLRGWLGRDADGDPYLPDAYSGRIFLHPAVSSDWQQLQMLISPGVNRTDPEILRTALGLVRGAALADAAPGQWSWAEELRGDIMATIRDIAVVLTDHALSTGDIDLARWSTARALTVTPEDEELMCARIRVERHAGNHREVERLALKTTAHARRLGVDLNAETVRLIQEVMEGRIRARTIIT